jgi:hypothetical protein
MYFFYKRLQVLRQIILKFFSLRVRLDLDVETYLQSHVIIVNKKYRTPITPLLAYAYSQHGNSTYTSPRTIPTSEVHRLNIPTNS